MIQYKTATTIIAISTKRTITKIIIHGGGSGGGGGGVASARDIAT